LFFNRIVLVEVIIRQWEVSIAFNTEYLIWQRRPLVASCAEPGIDKVGNVSR